VIEQLSGKRQAVTMTLDKARELIQVQCELGGGYNRNGVRMVLAEPHRQHGQTIVDRLIREFDLEIRFGIEPGSDLSRFGL
jgi:hypothetical protein